MNINVCVPLKVEHVPGLKSNIWDIEKYIFHNNVIHNFAKYGGNYDMQVIFTMKIINYNRENKYRQYRLLVPKLDQQEQSIHYWLQDTNFYTKWQLLCQLGKNS